MSATRLRGGAPARPVPPADRRKAGTGPAHGWAEPHAAPRWGLVRRVLLVLAIILLALLLLGGIAAL